MHCQCLPSTIEKYLNFQIINGLLPSSAKLLLQLWLSLALFFISPTGQVVKLDFLAIYVYQTSMKYDLKGKRPQWKTTSMENDLNGRRPQWKSNSMEDDLNERRHQWKMNSMVDNRYGRQPQWKTTLMKDNLNER